MGHQVNEGIKTRGVKRLQGQDQELAVSVIPPGNAAFPLDCNKRTNCLLPAFTLKGMCMAFPWWIMPLFCTHRTLYSGHSPEPDPKLLSVQVKSRSLQSVRTTYLFVVVGRFHRKLEEPFDVDFDADDKWKSWAKQSAECWAVVHHCKLQQWILLNIAD